MYKYIFQTPKGKDITSDFFFGFITNFVAHGLIGLILGATLDYLSTLVARLFISKKKDDEMEKDTDGNTTKNTDNQRRMILFSLGAVQLFINGLVLFSLTLILPPFVYGRWQETLPGLAFPSLFFGIQVNMFTNIRAILE